MSQEMKSYQLKMIFSPLSGKEKIKETVTDLKKKIEEGNGVALRENPSLESENKKSRFFYPIKKFLEGYYQTIIFSASPDSISWIESHLRSQKDILRFMLTTKKDSQAKPAKETLDLRMIDKIEPIRETLPARGTLPVNEPEEKAETKKKPKVKKEKVKLEELDKKLKEILG